MKNYKKNIILIGPSGAGKSTAAQDLAELLNREFYDTDRVIEERSGVSISWIFDVEGEAGFRKRETKVLEDLLQLSGCVIATGGGSILEPKNRSLMTQSGLIIYMKATIDQQIERVRRTEHRPLLKVSDLKQTLLTMKEERQPLYENLADVSFSTDSASIKSIVKDIYAYLTEQGY